MAPPPPDLSAELSPAEITAIISLLQDQDERTDAMIVEQLLARPPASRHAVIEQAEAAGVWTTMRLARVHRQNRREALGRQFATLAREAHGDMDLESAAFLVARIGIAEFDEGALRAELDRWAEDVQLAMSDPDGEAPAGLEALRTVLFRRLRFHGEHDGYYAPENSFLPHVMRSRVGLPITLSVIVLLVAQRLSLPVRGIGMPGHFVLRYGPSDGDVYLDPFDDGAVLTADDCRNLLKTMGLPTKNALDVAGPTAIVVRMLTNLANAYGRLGDEEGVADCRSCLEGLAEGLAKPS